MFSSTDFTTNQSLKQELKRFYKSYLNTKNDLRDISNSLSQRLSDVENNSSLYNRLTQSENSINSLQNRVNSLETWRGNKASAITNVTTSTSGLSVDVLGVGVMAAQGTQARLTEYGKKINAILAALRSREIIIA